MTLNDIRNAAASYLGKTAADFTVNGVDLSLIALNQARQAAELANDLNFTRRLMKLDVDGVTGGSLSNAIDYYTNQGGIDIKTIIDVGQFDLDGNLRPVEWTTVAAGLDRERAENRGFVFRYPTDGQSFTTPYGMPRFVFTGSSVYLFPKTTTGSPYTIGMEVYTMSPDWTGTDLPSTPDPWAKKGSQYLLWSIVIHLNNIFKEFVFRQEGNLPPPQTLVDQALAAFITWDIFKYEQFRRHNR